MLRTLAQLLDLIAWRHRRIACWIAGAHQPTPMTDPICCARCATPLDGRR